jgi:RNA polymerase sigma-70 factor (TIGR02960 family)
MEQPARTAGPNVMHDGSVEATLLSKALEGDEAAFERLVDRYRRELYAHCYRMLGSVQDAEDGLQESLLAAWRGLGSFEGRSSLRSWLYRVCTNACLRLSSRRPKRILSMDYGPPFHDTSELGEWVSGPVWLEPLPDERSDIAVEEADPAVRYQRRESVELAFIAALQHLPSNQRAVLILRDVLDFSAAETAGILEPVQRPSTAPYGAPAGTSTSGCRERRSNRS